MNKIKDVFLNKLNKLDLKYAVITGIYEELIDDDTVRDLDIVFFDISCKDLKDILYKIGVKHNIYNNYLYEYKNAKLPIDIYIDYINTGYYFLFKIDKNDLINRNGICTITENDYIVYQFLEPIIKFSEYKNRHKIRLKKYIQTGYVTPEVQKKLQNIIGIYFTNYLINVLKNDKQINQFVLKLLKLKLLFINNNFIRLIKKRILKNENCLY